VECGKKRNIYMVPRVMACRVQINPVSPIAS
jgi:hypothetical protein